ncbi:hypothetical protein KCP69_03020 [Salmonella enterica subsp. enterica]|nr:hypothetical protein KCP69_03020 [Salmonella enterica subsp. enterica]
MKVADHYRKIANSSAAPQADTCICESYQRDLIQPGDKNPLSKGNTGGNEFNYPAISRFWPSRIFA